MVLANISSLLTEYVYPGKLPSHPLVTSSSLLVIANYAKCIGQSGVLVPPALHYVVPALTDAALAEPSARAFREVCGKSGTLRSSLTHSLSLSLSLSLTHTHTLCEATDSCRVVGRCAARAGCICAT